MEQRDTENRTNHQSNRASKNNKTIDSNNNKNTSSIRDINLEIQDIDEVGPTTAKKLKEAGILSVTDLAVTSAEQLVSSSGTEHQEHVH
jgi:DNA repair protein RadA